jgi:hypothetical protein
VHSSKPGEDYEVFIHDTGVATAFCAKFIMNFKGVELEKVAHKLSFKERAKWETDNERPAPLLVEDNGDELVVYQKSKKPPMMTFMSQRDFVFKQVMCKDCFIRKGHPSIHVTARKSCGH